MSLQWLEQLIGVRDRWSHCVTISPISGRALAHTRQSFCFSRVYTEKHELLTLSPTGALEACKTSLTAVNIKVSIL